MADDRQAPATATWRSLMMARHAALTVVVLAVFVLHLVVAAMLLDSRASNAGHALPISHTD